MKQRKLNFLFALLAILSLILAACGSSAPTESPATEAPVTEAVATEAPAEAPAKVVALKVTGAVASEQGWSEEEVQAMPTLDVTSKNNNGESASYTGVLISELVAAAQPNADANTVVFVSDTGSTAEISLADITACADCIISFRNKGGFSTVLPGKPGNLQVKGVVEIQVVAGAAAAPANPALILATTTSTQDSGLLDVLIPLFQEQSGYTVQTVAVGSGEAMKMGEEGNADVLLVHAPASEKTFMEAGNGTDRFLVMHNDFIIVGPAADPAGIKGMTVATDAFKAIFNAGANFVTRGDDSGTHKKELALWKSAELDPAGQAWYTETGQGMGASMTVASETESYILTDRATYLANKDNYQLEILVEGDKSLLNVYHVITVNQTKWPKVNYEGALAFANFMIDPATQEVISQFGADKFGQPLFFPDADKTDADLGLN
ncbi:MAG TPA: substrate-binding domain-containing protein [Anaerolineales bacterium]|nr:substrate-binding domain-containing protein [Anaerolineales bacterium]HNN64377.1 substrate-binding domain-containing protein [Candidatus Obscuribacter sp.]